MTKRAKGRTAAEVVAALQANPEYVARRRTLDEQADARRVSLALAEAPVVQAIHERGRRGSDPCGIWSTRASRTPTLSTYCSSTFRKTTLRSFTKGIARSLAVPYARRHWPTLLRLFRSHSDGTVSNGVKWALGCALAASATEDEVPDLVALVREPRHGANRIAFLRTLVLSRCEVAADALREAENDPDLTKEAKFQRRGRRRKT
jgi:hypothetical protein